MYQLQSAESSDPYKDYHEALRAFFSVDHDLDRSRGLNLLKVGRLLSLPLSLSRARYEHPALPHKTFPRSFLAHLPKFWLWSCAAVSVLTLYELCSPCVSDPYSPPFTTTATRQPSPNWGKWRRAT